MKDDRAAASNVIKGPWASEEKVEQGGPVLNTAVLDASRLKAAHIYDALNVIIPLLFNHIEQAGFIMSEEMQDDAFALKEGTFIVEAIKSLLCRHYGIEHPFQDLVDAVLVMAEDGELEVAKTINIELKTGPVLPVVTDEEEFDEDLEEE